MENMYFIYLFTFIFIYFFSEFYAQCGTCTHNRVQELYILPTEPARGPYVQFFKSFIFTD